MVVILNIFSNANKKLSVLCGLFQQRRILFQWFFEAQFRYDLHIWMYCSRSANNKINKPLERAFRLVYDDYKSTFEKNLSSDGSFTKMSKTFRNWKNS